MSYKPPYLVFDFETEENGEASTEMYRPGFYVSSCAFCWKDGKGDFKTHYIDGIGAEKKIRQFLEKLADQQIPIVCHNEQFERGVTLCRFPGLAERLNWHADTMRLVQNFDNGGGEFQFMPLTYEEQLDFFLSEFENLESDSKKKNKKKKPTQKFVGGLGLKNAGMRILSVEDHKKKAHEWLRENVEGCRKGNEGSFLHMLPEDLMRDYNIADVITTARLYDFITGEFDRIGFDWRIDHSLYRSTLDHITKAKIEGIRIEREQLAIEIEKLRSEIEGIGKGFAERFAEEIRAVERSKLLQRIAKLKTLRGRKAYIKRSRSPTETVFDDEIRFNVGSNKQLASLFIDQLGISAKFLTETGQPAFRSSVLSQWGVGGEMLKTRRKRMLVLKQSEALHKLSAFDGKWHCDLKCCGTATGRMAGGSA